jgi:hypothetical protein
LFGEFDAAQWLFLCPCLVFIGMLWWASHLLGYFKLCHNIVLPEVNGAQKMFVKFLVGIKLLMDYLVFTSDSQWQ